MSKIGETGKVLIVDDNHANVRLISVYLKTAGYETEMAYDGEEALQKIEDTDPDLLLLDVMMPKMDGYEVCRRLRADEATSVIPIVMITALTGSEDRIRGIEVGADDFISKPFEKSELLARVKNLLRIKYYRSMVAERRKFDAIIEGVGVGIVITDPDYMTTVVNPEAQLLLGKVGEDCTGKDLFALFDDFEVTPNEATLKDAGQRVRTLDFEQQNVSPAVYLSGRLTHITDTAGNLSTVALLFRDVSEERRKEKLQRDFLSLVSHKLKTPLTIVSGYLSLIAAGKYGEMNQEMTDNFKLVEGRVHDLRALIEKLLQYAGLSADELRNAASVVDLRDMAARSIDRIVARYGESHVDFEIDIPGDLPQIWADVEHMALVLDNLMDNAVKFTSGNLARVRILAEVIDDGMIEITVQDYGPGIPYKNQADIFSDFLQVEEWFTGNVGGMGLGLPTAKRLVESWGGQIRVESKPGEGARFIFTVRRHDPQHAHTPRPAGGPGHMETA